MPSGGGVGGAAQAKAATPSAAARPKPNPPTITATGEILFSSGISLYLRVPQCPEDWVNHFKRLSYHVFNTLANTTALSHFSL